jgi:hypothetical protein
VPAKAAEGRARFCEIVFDAADVRAIVPAAGELAPRASARPPEAGVGECLVSSAAADVDLVVDCRPEHPGATDMREALAGQPGVRDVAIGRGGVRTRDDNGPIERLVFELEHPPCTAFVSIARADGSAIEPLARHVEGELTRVRAFAP